MIPLADLHGDQAELYISQPLYFRYFGFDTFKVMGIRHLHQDYRGIGISIFCNRHKSISSEHLAVF